MGHILTADFKYKVQPYQRNFSWTLEEVEQLWNDIDESIQDDRPEYFLGTIVVHENRDDKERTIIDGQQRLATLTMMLAAVRTVYAEHNDEREKEVYKDYLGVKDRRTRVTESRLTLNSDNEPVFQTLVIENAADAVISAAINDKALSPSNVLLAKAIKFVREVVRKKADASPRYENFLLQLEEFLRDRVVLILVAVGDEADAYLIFETLNDRGLDLSISDLLKNYIFGRAGNRSELVRKQWEEMAFLLGTQDQTQFLRHHWLSQYGIVRERDLYKEMKRKFSSQQAVLKLMSELRDAADNYSAISNVDHPTWQEYDSAVRKDLETLQLFGISQFRPLLLAALDVLDQTEIAKVIRIIVVLSMRYSIIGALGTGNIERAYSDAAVAVRKKEVNKAAKVFAKLKPVYPDDTRFKADFSQKEIGKAKLARYILTAIGNVLQGNKTVSIIEDEKLSTLEHIMPKNKTGPWQKAAKDHAEYLAYVHRIGNLTLIEREKNMAVGNAAFDVKKTKAYSKSEILMTKNLSKFANWTVDTIERRQAEMAELAVRIWGLPY